MSSRLNEIAEFLRKIIRATQGLPTDDDVFNGLINVKDIRERTRLGNHEINRHSFLRLLAMFGGDEWKICDKIAEMEDTYYISLDGEQRKEAILMKQRQEQGPQQQVSVSVPRVETQPQEPPKKKGWLRR